ncbi:MAG: aldo/keto reductase [Opitutaceae bacterium]|nr:aldo/keto reductase [Opitutaceae bacterium]
MNPSLPPLPLGRLGLGCATVGREIGPAAAFALLDHALASGIVLFDTAATYSQGESERILGRWLAAHRGQRERLTVATKLYPPYTPENIRQAAAASAARLGVEVIDLFYLHKWDASVAAPGALAALDGLVRTGRVRALGASNFTAAQLAPLLARQQAEGFAPFRALQNNHNLAVREVDAPLRDLCARHGLGIVTYSPLGAGFLTGKHRAGVQAGSRFALSPGHQDIYFNPEAQRRLEKLAAVAARTGHSMSHLALAWAMHQPGTVLIGGRGPANIDQALAALAFNDPGLFTELESG